MPADERTDISHHRPDHSSSQDDHDQRRGEIYEKDVDADALRILQGDDEEKGDEKTHQPGAPVDRLLILAHRYIVKKRGRPEGRLRSSEIGSPTP